MRAIKLQQESNNIIRDQNRLRMRQSYLIWSTSHHATQLINGTDSNQSCSWGQWIGSSHSVMAVAGDLFRIPARARNFVAWLPPHVSGGHSNEEFLRLITKNRTLSKDYRFQKHKSRNQIWIRFQSKSSCCQWSFHHTSKHDTREMQANYWKTGVCERDCPVGRRNHRD